MTDDQIAAFVRAFPEHGASHWNEKDRYIFQGWNSRQPEINELLTTLRGLLSYARCNLCYHEETHRGGAIWEICNLCGAAWADDAGGKPAFVEPKELKAAAAILDKYSKVKP